MRILSVGAMIVLATSTVAGQGAPAATTPPRALLTNMGWLSGCWVIGTVDRPYRVEESWTSPSDHLMLSMTRHFGAGRATAWEYGRIEATDTGIVLTAVAKGVAESRYRLMAQAPDSMVFENPAAKPQRFIYRRASDSTYSIRVEEGTDKFTTTLRRMKCPG